MTRWEQVQELFEQVVDLAPQQRAAYLDERCAGNPSLRSEVEKLLAADGPAQNFLNSPAVLRLAPVEEGGQLVFSANQIVSGRYRVVRFLGSGGMGQVYAAEDQVLGELIALKTISPEIASDERILERFKQEIKLAKHVTSENVCRIYDLDHHNAPPFLTMELIEGETLAERLKRSGKRMTTVEALPLVDQMVKGLAAAHARGVVHRDLKPGNVMLALSKGGRTRVVMTDFGLARTVDSDSTISFAGTPDYMAPEQAEGARPTIASDIYALGLVMFEMVTGERPRFDRLRESPPSPRVLVRNLDPRWTAAILRCLERRPSQRFSSAEDVGQAIQGKKADGVNWRWLLAATALVLTLLATLVWWQSRRRESGGQLFLTRLTSDSGLSAYPSLSSDGKLMAYASDRSGEGNLEIWLQQIGGGEPIRLTRHTADNLEPSLSPDGTKVAFRSEREGGGVYLVSALGGEARLIAPKGRGPRFSPDGRWISYWVGATGSAFFPHSSKIYVVPASGGEARLVHPEFAAAFSPIWSPNGRELLFLGRLNARVDVEGSIDWWLAPVVGGTATKTGAFRQFEQHGLTPAEGQDWIAPTTWQAEGNRILFAATLSDSTNVWEMPLSTGRQAGPLRRRTSGTGVELHPAVATGPISSQRMVYSSLTLNAAVWSVPVEESRGKVVGPLQKLTQESSYVASPSISADGLKLSFSSFGAGTWTVKVRDLETGKEKIIANDSARLESLISADGTKIIYHVGAQDRADTNTRGFQMYLADMSGGTAVKLCDQCGHPTDMSTDGQKILFEPLENTRNDVVMLDVASRQQVSIVRPNVHPEYIVYDGRFSPDGRWIACRAAMSRSTTDTKIFIVPVPEGQTPTETDWIPITEGHGFDGEACWSPDGNTLYYLSDRDGSRCIWAQHLHPVTKRPLRNPFAVQHFHHYRGSLARLRQGAAGLSVTRGMLLLAIGELNGNIWASEMNPNR